jgi:hypothetical protein
MQIKMIQYKWEWPSLFAFFGLSSVLSGGLILVRYPNIIIIIIVLNALQHFIPAADRAGKEKHKTSTKKLHSESGEWMQQKAAKITHTCFFSVNDYNRRVSGQPWIINDICQTQCGISTFSISNTG